MGEAGFTRAMSKVFLQDNIKTNLKLRIPVDIMKSILRDDPVNGKKRPKVPIEDNILEMDCASLLHKHILESNKSYMIIRLLSNRGLSRLKNNLSEEMYENRISSLSKNLKEKLNTNISENLKGKNSILEKDDNKKNLDTATIFSNVLQKDNNNYDFNLKVKDMTIHSSNTPSKDKKNYTENLKEKSDVVQYLYETITTTAGVEKGFKDEFKTEFVNIDKNKQNDKNVKEKTLEIKDFLHSEEENNSSLINFKDDYLLSKKKPNCQKKLRVKNLDNDLEWVVKKRSRASFETIMIHYHGGGFVAMSSSSHQTYLIKWAKKLDIPIFSIDYRLAPVAQYPDLFDDCIAGYLWV